MSGWRRLALGGLLLSGCGAPVLPPGFGQADALAFQKEHEREIGAEVGPLSAVASYYVEPGQTLALGVVGDALGPAPEGPGPRVRIEVTDAGARCLEGCDAGPIALEGPRTVTLDRFSLLLSPQSGATRVLVHDPRAPGRQAFDGLHWFPVDLRFIVPATFEPDAERPTVELSTSRGLTKPFVRAGVLRAELLGHAIVLHGYQAGGGTGDTTLLVPFTDRTTGDSTYPVGRYLQVTLPADGSGTTALDLNRATNPYCAYSEHYNCPIPPADNGLALAVEAGEQLYDVH
ncbi:DUF1684 domain-containing protein [Paraliomyxa miuraensis]|uniref:DUF1684 domain-containing protein n=1 Tax=Paraliomyxa miuraensis TaxID=376150 RepID=UPI002259C6B8|nr:DUF1684 domain-containing protein [Paraliomyxa miuraensis]MCX4245635.1 DUF1684 domain-containing protein [Paraliomyxa miuraensis]